MRDDLSAAAIQMEILTARPELNLAKAMQLLEEAVSMGAQLILLPEMWLTGFVLKREVEGFLPWTDKALALLSRFCSRKSCFLLAGSLMEREGEKLYNTAYFLNSEGQLVGKYRKNHLFAPMGELKVFTPGREIEVFPSSVGLVSSVICYDLRFPELVRILPFKGVEILCVPAQWPFQRIEHWEVLLRARAIENHFFVIGANRVGECGGYQFPGHSMIVDPVGRVLAQRRDEGVIIALIRRDVMDKYRIAIPALMDSVLFSKK